MSNMAKQSGIEWTDATWNPWRGCLKVSQGCAHCYMYRDQERHGNDPRAIVRSKTTFADPLKWRGPMKVFTCSWSDFFLEQADEWRGDAWRIIEQTPHLTYQILTKRPENVLPRLPRNWGNGWRNVWLGVSVETSAYLWRAETLANIPAVVRFISYEPALGPVDFSPILSHFRWLISGGESGPDARPANTSWFTDARRQCAKAGVAFFHKQNGGAYIADGSWGGRKLFGVEYNQFPKADEPALPVQGVLL